MDTLGIAVLLGSMELATYILDRLETEPVILFCEPLSVAYKSYLIITVCSFMFSGV
jgi:hypothetical protein